MTDTTSLGNRMKSYEKSYDTVMPGRLPVVVRLDGKGFSRWTKKTQREKPFDTDFTEWMSESMRSVASQIDGCVFAYTQSDEVSFVLKNDQTFETTPWFGNRVQKIGSVISSMMTAHFNKRVAAVDNDFPLAYFDARVFIVPDFVEAANCLLWRQNDCTKNSISAACYYEVAKVYGKKTTRKLMHELNQKQQQELLFQEAGINWNDYPTYFKRGIGTYRIVYETTIDGNACTRSSWKMDKELPIFARDQSFLGKLFGLEGEDD